MKLCHHLRITVVTLASLGLICPQAALCVEPAQEAAAVRDYQLGQGGMLAGQVVDAQGQVQPGQEVFIVQDGRALAQTQTNPDGRFCFMNVPGGVYEIHTASGSSLYRAWMPNTAPPSAVNSAMVVNGTVVRGSGGCGCGPLQWLGNHPLLLGGIVAAAVAIPIALDDDNAS